MPGMNAILNISAYRFVSLPDAHDIRPGLLALAQRLDIKGTIVLAEEGINLFVAGAPAAVRELLTALQADPRLTDLTPKESWSALQPFKRMRVKVKPEIIRMNQPAIRPQAGRAPAVDALTLKRWLDQGHDDIGRPVVTLDTRNAFEIEHGAFDRCIDWQLGKFSEFPAAASARLDSLRDKTVVSYCTGGIRCEKAAIHLRNAGLEHVYQLDGGILRYFEQAGASHYHGSCFVFDERSALLPDLTPAGD